MPKGKHLQLRQRQAGPAPPRREMVLHRRARRAKRNAGGGGMRERTNPLWTVGGSSPDRSRRWALPERAGLTPLWAGVATGGASLAGSALVKSRWAKDALVAAAGGAAGVAALQLAARHLAKPAVAQPAKPSDGKHRQADGDPPYVTRQELNDALSRAADQQRDQQKQSNCDLLTAFRSEIRRTVAEVQQPRPAPSYLTPVPTRAAAGEDDYMRNAYADDERNAYAEERDASGEDEYMGSAYGDEERNAFAEDERNAFADDERNAFGMKSATPATMSAMPAMTSAMPATTNATHPPKTRREREAR